MTSSVLKDFPSIKFIIPHGGGAVPYHWGRYRGLAQDAKLGLLSELVLENVFFDTCVYHLPGQELLAKVIPVDNILFASEMIGAVRGIDPETGHHYDDTKTCASSPPKARMRSSRKPRCRTLPPTCAGICCTGDGGYDDARKVWNGMIDRRPALIARCAGVADVINSINFARTHRLLVAVRGGGHNVAGNATCDGGLMIDLSEMHSIRVDPAQRTARAEAGATWGELDQETQTFGLATPRRANIDHRRLPGSRSAAGGAILRVAMVWSRTI